MLNICNLEKYVKDEIKESLFLSEKYNYICKRDLFNNDIKYSKLQSGNIYNTSQTNILQEKIYETILINALKTNIEIECEKTNKKLNFLNDSKICKKYYLLQLSTNISPVSINTIKDKATDKDKEIKMISLDYNIIVGENTKLIDENNKLKTRIDALINEKTMIESNRFNSKLINETKKNNNLDANYNQHIPNIKKPIKIIKGELSNESDESIKISNLTNVKDKISTKPQTNDTKETTDTKVGILKIKEEKEQDFIDTVIVGKVECIEEKGNYYKLMNGTKGELYAITSNNKVILYKKPIVKRIIKEKEELDELEKKLNNITNNTK